MIRSSIGHNTQGVLWLSATSNIAAALFTGFYLIYLNRTNQKYLFDLSTPESIRHSQILGVVGGLPITLLTFLLNLGITDANLIGQNMLVLYILILLSVLKPFGKMNHVALHICIMFETWVLCKINTYFHPIG
jgi:uncharacterized membrane protein